MIKPKPEVVITDDDSEEITEQSLSPTTTHEEDLHTASQRKINITWETTQAVIAVMVTAANIYAALKGINSESLNNSFFLIVGFYFGRTNHQRIGGVSSR